MRDQKTEEDHARMGTPKVTSDDSRTAPAIVDNPPMPAALVDSARRFKAVMVPVPLNDCEKLPDPDYGF